MLEEPQDPFDPSGALNRLLSFGTLRRSALTGGVYYPLGGFGLRGKNRNEAVAIDVDQRVQESVEITHGMPPLALPKIRQFKQTAKQPLGRLGKTQHKALTGCAG